MTVLVLVETVVLLVLCVLVAGLLRAYGTVLRRLHQLDATTPSRSGDFSLLPVIDKSGATPAPPAAPADERFGPAFDIVGETVTGEIVSARVVDVEHDSLLLFLSSGCITCATFWEELATPGAVDLPRGTRLLVVPQSAEDESVSVLADLAPAGVDVVLSSQAWRDYGVPGSPHVVYVDGRAGKVRGEGTGQSLQQVTALLQRSGGDGALDRNGKPRRDAEQEAEVDRELIAAGILPGDPRLYGSDGERSDA
ncbi:hypothetical protein [Jatrophihabitans fulvus]